MPSANNKPHHQTSLLNFFTKKVDKTNNSKNTTLADDEITEVQKRNI